MDQTGKQYINERIWLMDDDRHNFSTNDDELGIELHYGASGDEFDLRPGYRLREFILYKIIKRV